MELCRDSEITYDDKGLSGQIMNSSPELTPNGGFYRKFSPKCFDLEL